MLHHFSIAAENPSRVAQVLAEVWQGKCAPFPPHAGSFMALAMDAYGTMIEVYPAETELMPGSGTESAIFSKSVVASPFSATHVAISIPTNQEQIERIAAREGWHAVRCNREDFFDVIEFWVENKVMLEFLTPSMAARYCEFMQPENLAKFLTAEATVGM